MLSFNFSLDEKDYYAFQIAFQKEREKERRGRKGWMTKLRLAVIVMILLACWSYFQYDGMSTVITLAIFAIVFVVYELIGTIFRGKSSRINPLTALIIKQQVSKFRKNP